MAHLGGFGVHSLALTGARIGVRERGVGIGVSGAGSGGEGAVPISGCVRDAGIGLRIANSPLRCCRRLGLSLFPLLDLGRNGYDHLQVKVVSVAWM
jgi:hypothetical protein